MANNDVKKRVLDMASSPTTSQVDDEFDILAQEQDVHEFDGKCIECRDIVQNGHAVMCAEVGCKAILHPGCFGTHMVTVHAVESLPVIIRRDTENDISRYIIKGELTTKEKVSLGRETVHVRGNEIEESTPSIEVKKDSGTKGGKKPIPKKEKPKTQRDIRGERSKKRMADKPVHKDKVPEPEPEPKKEPETTDDSV